MQYSTRISINLTNMNDRLSSDYEFSRNSFDTKQSTQMFNSKTQESRYIEESMDEKKLLATHESKNMSLDNIGTSAESDLKVG